MAWLCSLPLLHQIVLLATAFIVLLVVILFLLNECWNHRRSDAVTDQVRYEWFDLIVQTVARPIYFFFTPPSSY